MREQPTLVTGAAGFLGRLLVRRLVDEGRRVRVLERRPSDAFDGLPVERARGDVGDPASLRVAATGMEVVHNLAGVVSYDPRDDARLQAVNVDGVAHVLDAAAQAGVRRIVHVSSVAAVGMAPGPDAALDEDAPFPEAARRYAYARTKRAGEQLALDAAARGLDVVVACPAFVIGAGDVNRVSTFAVEQYLRGVLRTIVPGGLSYVGADDVVEGLLLLERSGSTGRRYILGAPDGNLSHRDFFALVGRTDGRPRRQVELPATALVGAARALRRLRVPLPVSPHEIENGRWYWYHTTRRAIDELGYRPRPVTEAVEATVRWYRHRGLRPR